MLLICSHELRKNIPHYKRTGGSESRTQVLASYCSSDVIDPGSHTHTSPGGSRGILGLSRHMTNCSVLLHKHISAARSHLLSARGGSDAFPFFLTQLRYLNQEECNKYCCPTDSRTTFWLQTRQVLYVLTHSLHIECALYDYRRFFYDKFTDWFPAFSFKISENQLEGT